VTPRVCCATLVALAKLGKVKKSREHFQIKTHSRLIDLLDPTHETTVALKDLDLPAGVDIAVKV
jgi:small subunit ribosomal protein S10